MSEITYLALDTAIDGNMERRFIALDGMNLVGVVQMKFANRVVAEVKQLFVREDYRNRKIGTNLMKACEQTATTEGCAAIALTVVRENRKVLAFYKKLGFDPMYEFGDGELVINKTL